MDIIATNFLHYILPPFVIFLSIYIICLAIYSLQSKNKSNFDYLFNINFHLYIISIIVLTLFLQLNIVELIISIKTIPTILSIKNICLLSIASIIFTILYKVLKRMIIIIKGHDNGISRLKLNSKSLTEIQTMLKEYDNQLGLQTETLKQTDNVKISNSSNMDIEIL